MSTIATTNLKHPSSATNNLTLASTGAVAVNGSMTGAGLDLVVSQTFSSSTTISVNNCFSNLYENYRIIMYIVASSNNWTSLRFRSNGVDTSSGYTNQRLRATTTTVGATSSTAATEIFIGEHDTAQSVYAYDIITPRLARATSIIGSNMRSASVQDILQIAAANTSNTQFDGFSIFGGTLSGSLRVYGYKNT